MMTRREAARLGGLARAARLTPARRREIAAMGFRAPVDRRFGGDRQAAIDWLVARGLAAQDDILTGVGCRPFVRFRDPGPMPARPPDGGTSMTHADLIEGDGCPGELAVRYQCFSADGAAEYVAFRCELCGTEIKAPAMGLNGPSGSIAGTIAGTGPAQVGRNGVEPGPFPPSNPCKYPGRQ